MLSKSLYVDFWNLKIGCTAVGISNPRIYSNIEVILSVFVYDTKKNLYLYPILINGDKHYYYFNINLFVDSQIL